mgnify:CR=1 FL=1
MSTTEINSGSLVTINVKANGTFIPDIIEIQSLEVDKGVNKIPTAKILIIDNDISKGEFSVSSSSTFVPGTPISIEGGYDSKNEVIFEGIVTKQSIRINKNLGSVLEVECKDEAIKMLVGQKSKTFSKNKDSDIIANIISSYSGLTANVTATPKIWPEQVQHYISDWSFILSCAEINGMLVNVINNKVSVFPPNRDIASVLEIKNGTNLLELNAELNSITQLGKAKATAWDFTTQNTISGEASNNYTGPGNLTSKKLSEVVGLKEYELQSTAPIEKEDLTNWSKDTLLKSAFSKIIGDIKIQGTSKVNPGNYITLSGVGDRFNGDHFISSVKHIILNGNWTTITSIGLSPIFNSENSDLNSLTTSSLISSTKGLFNATVKKMYEDPENQYRVLVDIPLFDKIGEGIWARLSNFYASSGAGAFFMPEVGDEVVVGFLNEDPRFPIILGSLYSSKKNKPYDDFTPDEKNSIKAIMSKSGISLQFDDENKVFTLTTPNKNTAIFSDKEKKITIKDQNNNCIEMSESGISLKSESTINIESAQTLNLKGATGVNIDAPIGDVQINGLNIKSTAEMEYSAEGSMTASLQGGTETTIKGAMVMIN